MTKPLELPIPVATDAAYDFEVWPVGHPLAGQQTPWSLQPTKDPAAEAAFASKGWHPGKRVFGPGLNSRGQKIDAMMAWSFAGTPDATPDTVAERDEFGDSAFAGVSFKEGPWSRYSHAAAQSWQARHVVSERTFAAQGAASIASAIVHDITSPLTDRELFDINLFPTNCGVWVHYDASMWVGDPGFLVADAVAHLGRTALAFFVKEGVVWAGGASSPPAEVSTGNLALFPSVQGDSTKIHMRGQWDVALDGLDYRAITNVSIRVLELD